MKYYKLLLSLVCTAIISSSYANASDKNNDPMKSFYIKPTFSKFEYIVLSLIDENEHMKPWQYKIIQVFATMSIYNNKDYPSRIINNFPKYSAREKEFLVNALYNSDNIYSIDVIKKKYHYTSRITSRYPANDIIHLQINDNADHLDQAWAAFFATGNNIYLTKILTYINSDKFLLSAAAEILNREALCNTTKSLGTPEPSLCSKDAMSEMKQSIKVHYPLNAKEKIYKLTVVYSGLWSIEANYRDNINIAEAINKIIKINPSLNYSKTTREALN